MSAHHSTPKHFENENISVNLTRKPHCQVQLDVTVNAKASKAAYQQALKEVAKEVSIPGFRKGKAPTHLIIKNFSKQVHSEWKELLIKTTFHEAVELSDTPLFNNQLSHVDIKDASPEHGATLRFEYESSPEVPEIIISELTLPKVERKEIGDEEVQNALTDLALEHAEWNTITDRSAMENDYAELDIDFIDAPARSICKKSMIRLTSKDIPSWLKDKIFSMQPGETIEGTTEPSEKEKNAPTPFQPRTYRIHLHTIKTATLPAFDDALAQKFNVNTIDELKTKLRDELNQYAEEAQQEEQRLLARTALLNHYHFDIPYTLVGKQIEQQSHNIIKELQAEGLSEEQISEESRKVKENLANRLNADFRLWFIVNKIAEMQDIKIEQAEITNELFRQISLQPSGKSYLNDLSNHNEVHQKVYSHVLHNKILDCIIEQQKDLQNI